MHTQAMLSALTSKEPFSNVSSCKLGRGSPISEVCRSRTKCIYVSYQKFNPDLTRKFLARLPFIWQSQLGFGSSSFDSIRFKVNQAPLLIFAPSNVRARIIKGNFLPSYQVLGRKNQDNYPIVCSSALSQREKVSARILCFREKIMARKKCCSFPMTAYCNRIVRLLVIFARFFALFRTTRA